MIQGSDTWKDWRSKRITASRFGDVLAGKNTKRRKMYIQELRLNICGIPDFQEPEKPWFDHGKEMEPEARGRYEWETGLDAVTVPAIVHPKYDFISCSPDFIVCGNNPIGGEIKSHLEEKNHTVGKLPAVHKPQVQGCLWITGFSRWDFVSYWNDGNGSGLDVFTVYPDYEYFCKLEKKCLEFWAEVKEGL